MTTCDGAGRRGGYFVNLSLPAGEPGLLDQANITDEHGNVVTEIVPADQPGPVQRRLQP